MCWIIAGSLASNLPAVTPDRMFGDNMVIQREMPVPVWGKAKPDSTVTVTFAGKTVEGKTNQDGAWEVSLPELPASSEGRDLVIKSGEHSITFSNVLVGEVWLGSGQSNMAGKVSSYSRNDPTLAKLVDQAPYPNLRIKLKDWHEADADTANKCSALLFAFGERLQRELGVPVGLFFGAVGGTPSGSWIPLETYETSEKCKADIASFAKTWDPAKAQKNYETQLTKWEQEVEAATAAGRKPRGRRPRAPVNPGEMTRDGKIGGLFARYIKPSMGFAIRGVLWDQGESGTGILGLNQHTAMSELFRGWRELWGQGDFPFIFVQKPSGESCAFSKDNPMNREAGEFSELPKTIVQNGSTRFLYTRLMKDNKNAWMVPSSDLGGKIHPVNKWAYGNRAGEVALQKIYQIKGVQAYGPIYQSHKVDGSTVTVTFSETGSGLTLAHSDNLQGFSLAGEGGQWFWAEAKITGENTVSVTCPSVPSPKHVRFAYAVNRHWANLFNKEGLPALAFTSESL